MNKKIITIVGIVVLLGIGYFLYSRRSSSSPIAGPNSQTIGQTMSEAAEFAKAVQSGRPTICTLTKGEDTMEYLLKGKQMRANMKVSTPVPNAGPVVTKSHMINDGNYLYLWSDGQKQGSKMSITEPSPVTPTTTAPERETPRFTSESDYNSLKDQGYTINCQSGPVSADDFVPPKDVEFIDPSAMMKKAAPPTTNGAIDYKKLQEQYGSMMPQE